jgi:hypothetical protein
MDILMVVFLIEVIGIMVILQTDSSNLENGIMDISMVAIGIH